MPASCEQKSLVNVTHNMLYNLMEISHKVDYVCYQRTSLVKSSRHGTRLLIT